jgi:hypothetical protein
LNTIIALALGFVSFRPGCFDGAAFAAPPTNFAFDKTKNPISLEDRDCFIRPLPIFSEDIHADRP